MALKLVLGPANAAKAGEVLGAYGAIAPRGAVLVVPTAADARHYRRELVASGVVFGSVLTFSGLTLEIGRRAGFAARRLSDRQRELLLRRAVAGAQLQVMGESGTAPGFRHAAGALIAELTRSLVTPQRFAAALRTWAAAGHAPAAYAAELGRIPLRYAAELERLGAVDRELLGWRALDALRAAPERWGRDEVFFYGFDDLTRLEQDAVETLARVVDVPVCVSLPFQAGRAALAARAGVVAELRPLAGEVLELPVQDTHYAAPARAALHHAEQGLFEIGVSARDPGETVTLMEAGGERAEAELIGAEILAQRRAGVPGAEIAVVVRSLQSAPLIAGVLREYGLAASCPVQVPFTHAPLGRALVGAARCALNPDAGADELLAYLRAPGLLERPELADGLEASLARDGVWDLAAARERLGWRLGELEELAAASRPGRVLCRLGRRLLVAGRRGQAAELDERESLDARALSALSGALDDLEALGAQSRGSDLLELLEDLAVDDPAPAGPDHVVIAEPLQVRARRFAVVFVAGLQEGAFPRAVAGDPFLSDESRRELAASTGLHLGPTQDTLEGERYLLYTTISRASERVFLSYRSSDEEGNVALPSPFLDDLIELFGTGWFQRRRRRLLADVTWPATTAPTERERRRALAGALAPVGGEPAEAQRRLGELGRVRLRHTRVVSANALETYAECPVRWLVQRELQPEPLEPESDPILRGNLIHATLERLIEQLDGPIAPETLRSAEAILERELAALAPGPGGKLGAGQPGVVRAGLLRAIEADLRRYLRHEAAADGGWRPWGTELRFGFEAEEGSLGELRLGADGDAVAIRGVIDRLDVDADGHALIRDYKSGAPRQDWPVARWTADQRLQVAIYLLAVRELTDFDPVAGIYQPLRGGDLRGRGVYVSGLELGGGLHPRDGRSREELDAELEAAAQRAVTLAAALRAGDVTPCPQSCSRDGCAYPGICRSQ